jgi:hypothetical protein
MDQENCEQLKKEFLRIVIEQKNLNSKAAQKNWDGLLEQAEQVTRKVIEFKEEADPVNTFFKVFEKRQIYKKCLEKADFSTMSFDDFYFYVNL